MAVLAYLAGVAIAGPGADLAANLSHGLTCLGKGTRTISMRVTCQRRLL